MSIKTNITTIEVENLLELEELSNSLEEKLDKYSLLHPDFSAVIEKHIDINQVIIKTMYLEESVN